MRSCEECAPDYAVHEFQIKARRLPDGIWEVWCPEWKCTLHGKNATRVIACLVAEIEKNNEQCGEEPLPANLKKPAMARAKIERKRNV
jgi:hypothetical protein